jgi:hypothetical protein
VKAKVIKAVISKKMNDWFDSIEDAALREQVRNNTIVTGGCIASMLLKEQVNDFDVYFRNRDTALKVANYYVARFQMKNKKGIPCKIWVDEEKTDRVRVIIKSSGIASEEGSEKPYDYFEGREEGSATGYVADIMSNPGEIEDTYDDLNEKAQEIDDGPKYRAVFMSTNAITLSHRVQLVLRFYGDPSEIHENYDFVHCTNYWTSWNNELVLNPKALEALLARELRYVGSKYPLCSIMRMRKFIGRGWTINAGQILKAVMQLQELDLKDPEVLEDQLTGVDSAYFVEIIAKVKENDPEKINTAYLIEIVDRLF